MKGRPRTPSRAAHRAGAGPWALAGLGALAALGLVWLVAGSGLPSLLAGPTADPVLGALNRCLLQALPSPRRAWAVSADARRVAAAAEAGVAVCTQAAGASGAVRLTARLPPPGPGVSALALDGQGRLWAASAAGLTWAALPDGAAPGPWAPTLALQAQGLWPLADGVLVLEAAAGGSDTALLSVAPEGALRARRAVPADARWTVGPEGRLVVGVEDGALHVLTADGLQDVRTERPCDVTAAAWAEPSEAAPGAEALWVACASGLTLQLWPRTGESSPVPPRPLPATQRLLSRPLHVGDCDGLPCSSAGP